MDTTEGSEEKEREREGGKRGGREISSRCGGASARTPPRSARRRRRRPIGIAVARAREGEIHFFYPAGRAAAAAARDGTGKKRRRDSRRKTGCAKEAEADRCSRARRQTGVGERGGGGIGAPLFTPDSSAKEGKGEADVQTPTRHPLPRVIFFGRGILPHFFVRRSATDPPSLHRKKRALINVLRRNIYYLRLGRSDFGN
mmetsp:Transcript_42376/g.128541  ORF Transcript_42376/g.128541 Transcript_42376/m.128541 type:complete len:200 (+) Transcript_42376:79-678(+)